jgi:hypothetical protein
VFIIYTGGGANSGSMAGGGSSAAGATAAVAPVARARRTAAASRVTPMEHTLIGAVGGVMEVCLMQPMVAFKNALQEGRPLPRTPLAMYRGLLVRSFSIQARVLE